MSTFLTQEELEDMTGKKQAAAQRRVLDRNGIRYIIRGDGRNSVTREQIETYQKPPTVDMKEGMPSWPAPPTTPLTLDAILALPSEDDAGNAPGLYFLLQGQEVVYVGISREVASRLYQHHCARLFRNSGKAWDDVRVIHCGPGGLEEAELAHIRHHRPRFNIKGLQ